MRPLAHPCFGALKRRCLIFGGQARACPCRPPRIGNGWKKSNPPGLGFAHLQIMPEQIARMYAYVHPAFWPWLWVQLLLVRLGQAEHGRNLLLAVTRCGNVFIIGYGDRGDAWRKPGPVRAAWDDPVWQTRNPPNLVGVFLEFSAIPPTRPSGRQGDFAERGGVLAGKGARSIPDTS